MKTIRKVEVIPVFVEFIPPKEEMLEAHIYISQVYETSIHLCLCGCKNQTVLPFSKGWWDMTINNEKVSFSPSIGNFQFPCNSHYIITNNIANFV